MPRLFQPYPVAGRRLSGLCSPIAIVFVLGTILCSLWTSPALGQRYRWHDEDFQYRRVVALPAGMETVPEVIVAEWFSHGAVKPEAGEIVVYASKELVPRQVLQRGPGDFARISFEPVAGESRYYLYYGSPDHKQVNVPAWTSRSGLLFETRHWKNCDVNSLDSVRQAYASSTRIGSDYVGGVFHRHHPFAPEQGPFLSRYVGTLNAPVKGEYHFYTSSQDCSFLLIDGTLVVSAPGQHPPESRAKVKGVLTLEAGRHRFEYFHAATGNETCMVAAWQLPGLDRPAKIAPEMFRFDRVLRIPPTQLEHRDKGYLPDYRLAILGDIPSSEPGEPAMVRTQFVDASADAIKVNAQHEWEFGDGQSSAFTSPGHVFLHPGPYRVSLKLQRGSKQPLISNQIYITRQFIVDAKGQEDEDIADYLETLEQYNSTSLDATGLVQLVRAYVLADDPVNATQAAAAAFTAGATGHTDQTRWVIARLIGPVLRDRLDNAKAAAKLWTDATAQIKSDSLRVSCAIRAADIFLNDLLQPGDAKNALNFVERHLSDASSITRSRYYRVLGDWQARAGNRNEARSAYSKAEVTRQLEFNATERTAWQGAHSRSTEAFLRSGELSRARETLEQWQADFPADKSSGYWSLLQSRYLYARDKYPQAIAAANDLLVVNPRSPYADQLHFMIGKCEEASARIPRAIATYQALITDYPGSPLVEVSKREIERLSNPEPEKQPKAAGQGSGKK